MKTVLLVAAIVGCAATSLPGKVHGQVYTHSAEWDDNLRAFVLEISSVNRSAMACTFNWRGITLTQAGVGGRYGAGVIDPGGQATSGRPVLQVPPYLGGAAIHAQGTVTGVGNLRYTVLCVNNR